MGLPSRISTLSSIADGGNIIIGTSTGTQIGTATAQKIGFHGATPVIQRTGAAQAAMGTTNPSTFYNLSIVTFSDPPTQAECQNLQSATYYVVQDLITLANELRAALVAKGLIKGSA